MADTFFTRLRGLLGTRQEQFVAGAGLWIYPSKGVHTLGMRYAIDAVYIDGGGHVIHCRSDLKPGRVSAIRKTAVGVLELPAGSIQSSQTQVGDVIWFAFSGARGVWANAGPVLAATAE